MLKFISKIIQVIKSKIIKLNVDSLSLGSGAFGDVWVANIWPMKKISNDNQDIFKNDESSSFLREEDSEKVAAKTAKGKDLKIVSHFN